MKGTLETRLTPIDTHPKTKKNPEIKDSNEKKGN